MTAADKLAEALRLAREWFRHEAAGEGPQADDVIKAADEAIAAHDAEQAQEPVPGVIWGYYGEDGASLVQRGKEDEMIGRNGGRRLYLAPVEQAAKAVPADPCVVLWQAMNEAEKVGNRTDDKLIVWALRRAGYCIAAISEQEPCHDAWRAALAQRREPVVPYLYVYEYDSPFGLNREFYPSGWNGQKPTRTVPLYTTPQPAQAERVGLTDEQIVRLWESSTGHKMPNMGSSMWQLLAVARAIECACAEAWGVKLGATTGEQQ